jgi:hypothetical protein
MLARSGDWGEAEAEVRRSVQERERLDGQVKGDPGTTLELARALAQLGETLVAPGRPPSAVREAEACLLYARSLRLFASVRDRVPKDQAWADRVALGARCGGRGPSGAQARSARQPACAAADCSSRSR